MSDKRLLIALICFDNPFLPPAEGGKRGMRTRIESLLYANRYDVDIYLMNKTSEGMAQSFGEIGEKAHAITQYPMRTGLSVLMGPYPICTNKRFVDDCVKDLKGKHYDIAIYEGEQVAKYRVLETVDADYHILYMHDIESAYRAEIAKSQSGIRRVANMMEAKRFRYIERKVDQYFDRVWYVSKAECETFSGMFRTPSKGVYIPFPALQIVDKPIIGEKAQHLLYVGDLSIKHNYLSVKWFAETVLPEVKRKIPGAQLKVVGRIDQNDAESLRGLGAEVCGYVDDLNLMYEEASCIVSPVLYGAGVKVKTIDALARGQIVITTVKGIEGTDLQDGKHLIVQDDASGMAEKCVQVLQNRKAFEHIAQQGLDYIRQEHTIARQAEIIDQEIMALMK